MTSQSSKPGQKISPYSTELEDLIASAKADCHKGKSQLDRQDMSGFGEGCSGNEQLFWRCQIDLSGAPPMKGNWGSIAPPPHLSVQFNMPAAGIYEIVLLYTTAPDYCAFNVLVDGQMAAKVAGYAAKVAPKARSLGQHNLAVVTNSRLKSSALRL